MENTNGKTPAPQNLAKVDLTPDQALSLIVQGIHYAQGKGIFTTRDSAILDNAISTFAPPQESALNANAPIPAKEVITEGFAQEAPKKDEPASITTPAI